MLRALMTKTLFILFMAAVMTGCKIAVIVPSGGQLLSSNPAHSCSEGNVCEFDINTGQLPFSESFTALPKEGYEFEKWSDGGGFLCAKSTNPTCTVSIGDGDIGAVIVSLFQSGYVMPIFKDVGIDTDADGVRNELDEDDDNDGIFDVNDTCPLDANPQSPVNPSWLQVSQLIAYSIARRLSLHVILVVPGSADRAPGSCTGIYYQFLVPRAQALPAQ